MALGILGFLCILLTLCIFIYYFILFSCPLYLSDHKVFFRGSDHRVCLQLCMHSCCLTLANFLQPFTKLLIRNSECSFCHFYGHGSWPLSASVAVRCTGQPTEACIQELVSNMHALLSASLLAWTHGQLVSSLDMHVDRCARLSIESTPSRL